EESMVQMLIEHKELSKLAELWVCGTKIEWCLLYKSSFPRRISVPTYPFARERHWVTSVAEKAAEQSKEPNSKKEASANLQSLLPAWKPVHFDASKRTIPAESTKILLLGGNQSQFDWVRTFYPNSRLLPLSPSASIENIEQALADCSLDQLLWIAPDVTAEGSLGEGNEPSMIAQQEQGVLAVF